MGLEAFGLVRREIFPPLPVQVCYHLTEKGACRFACVGEERKGSGESERGKLALPLQALRLC